MPRNTMIQKIMTYYAGRLDEYLSRMRRQPEGNAAVGQPGGTSAEVPNKLLVSLLNVERETSGGIQPGIERVPGGYARTYPSLLINLTVLVSAVYDERRYVDSLSALSDALRFVQSVPKFDVDGTFYTSELVRVSVQELNNIWTQFGGLYHPSVVCKIRCLTINGGEIASGGRIADCPVVET